MTAIVVRLSVWILAAVGAVCGWWGWAAFWFALAGSLNVSVTRWEGVE